MKKILLIMITVLAFSLSAVTVFVKYDSSGLNNGTSWADDPYGTFSLIDTVTSVTFTDNNSLPGNKYFYYVAAVSAK